MCCVDYCTLQTDPDLTTTRLHPHSSSVTLQTRCCCFVVLVEPEVTQSEQRSTQSAPQPHRSRTEQPAFLRSLAQKQQGFETTPFSHTSPLRCATFAAPLSWKPAQLTLFSQSGT
ncbi:hypothetical protein PAMP_000096 [Pampus punctatissimus]